MFSVIFPGQGSQSVGMAQNLYSKFDLIKNLFKEADQILEFPISKLILNGPKDKLDLTENTQPAIFLVGFSIFNLIQKEFKINLNNANFFAGHSLGEYTALACSDVLSFADTLKILKIRGKAMQNAVPKGEGGMIAVLGSDPESIEKILEKNKDRYECFIANDNSTGQLVLSGKNEDLEKLIIILKDKSIKNIKLPVSAPFHCPLMNKATKKMIEELNKLNFKNSTSKLISNVTAEEISDEKNLKELLIRQIENRVRWRESVLNMINKGTNQFIEIGPGKVLSGMVKRTIKNVNCFSINSIVDVENVLNELKK